MDVSPAQVAGMMTWMRYFRPHRDKLQVRRTAVWGPAVTFWKALGRPRPFTLHLVAATHSTFFNLRQDSSQRRWQHDLMIFLEALRARLVSQPNTPVQLGIS